MPDYNIQEVLGLHAKHKHHFNVCLPNDKSIYKPIYAYMSQEIQIGKIIGYLVSVNGITNLVFLKILAIEYLTLNKKQIKSITGEPILHNNDTRTMKDLQVSEFIINSSRINCVLRKG